MISERPHGGGKIIIPIFAIERAQDLIYYLGRLLAAGRIPAIPVYLDSPMAAQVNDVFRHHGECLDAEARRSSPRGVAAAVSVAARRADRAESMAINSLAGPAVVMATSGMCTAGRIKHHLAHHIGNPATTILFVGYQSQGTLGRQILDGNGEVRIHGVWRLVRAEDPANPGHFRPRRPHRPVAMAGPLPPPAQKAVLTHGEAHASLALAEASPPATRAGTSPCPSTAKRRNSTRRNQMRRNRRNRRPPSPAGRRRPSPPPTPVTPNRWALAAVCGLLLLAVGLVFGQTIGHRFVNLDNIECVRENPLVNHGLTLSGVKWAFTHSHANIWAPLTWLSQRWIAKSTA